MSKSEQFLRVCLAFVIGVGINSIFPWLNFLIKIPGYLFVLVFLSLIFLIKKDNSIVFLLFFLILGMYCYQLNYYKINNNFLYQLPDSFNCAISGTVLSPNRDIVGEKEIILKIKELSINDKKYRLNNSKIIIITDKFFEYGDDVKATGKIKQITNFKGFNYRMFLAKDGIYAKMAYPKIISLSKNNGNLFLSNIYKLRNYLEDKIGLFNFDDEQFAIISAMMLGDTKLMEKPLKDKLKFSGLSHIIAISGSHIAIFSEIIITLFLFFKFSKKKAIVFAMAFSWLFIIFSGFSISAVRSGIMGGIYLMSKFLNRQSAFLTNLVFALAIILAFNPILLAYDIGLQLSFASITGIFYLTKFFEKKLFFIPKLDPLNLRSVIAMTISAQIATIGIVLYSFGEFYPLGIIANLLIVPIAYYLMFCSLFFIIFSGIWSYLGYIFYFPTIFFVSYFQSVLNIFYNTANIKINYSFNLIFVFVFYGILVYTIYKLEKNKIDLIFSK